LPGCALDTDHLHAPEGFTIDHHELVFEGRCRDCN
jgi:Fe2+ or Zn2+ uptake regulation protein